MTKTTKTIPFITWNTTAEPGQWLNADIATVTGPGSVAMDIYSCSAGSATSPLPAVYLELESSDHARALFMTVPQTREFIAALEKAILYAETPYKRYVVGIEGGGSVSAGSGLPIDQIEAEVPVETAEVAASAKVKAKAKVVRSPDGRFAPRWFKSC